MFNSIIYILVLVTWRLDFSMSFLDPKKAIRKFRNTCQFLQKKIIKKNPKKMQKNISEAYQ